MKYTTINAINSLRPNNPLKQVIFNKNLHDTQNDALPQILHTKFQTGQLKIEQLNGSDNNIYAVKITDVARGICVIENDTLYVLEILPNHEYDKSTTLKTLSQLDLETLRLDMDSQADTADNNNEYQSQELQYKKLRCTNKVIEFAKTQEKIVDSIVDTIHSSGITVISGTAGSGKTTVAMEVAQKIADEAENDALFITKSTSLITKLQSDYNTYYSPEDNNTQFTTLKDLVTPLVLDKTIVSQDDFTSWYNTKYSNADIVEKSHKNGKSARKQQKSKVKNHSKTTQKSTDIDVNKIYQDIQKIACNTKGADGKKNIHDKDNKEILESILTKYTNYLTTKNQIDLTLNFDNQAITTTYQYIIIDESQDFAPREIEIIKALTEKNNGNLYFCVDINQSLETTYLPFETYLHSAHQQYSSFSLIGSYRNPPLVQKVIKNLFNKASVIYQNHDESVRDVEGRGGKIEWINATDSRKILAIKGVCDTTTDIAIIVSDDRTKEEAKKEFNTEMVFTVQEIKGLEFEHVILYKFFCSNDNKYLTESLLSDKPSQDIANLRVEYNKLYCAFSRTRQQLTIIDEQENNNQLQNILYSPFGNEDDNNRWDEGAWAVSPEDIGKFSVCKLKAMIQKLIDAGYKNQAKKEYEKFNALYNDTSNVEQYSQLSDEAHVDLYEIKQLFDDTEIAYEVSNTTTTSTSVSSNNSSSSSSFSSSSSSSSSSSTLNDSTLNTPTPPQTMPSVVPFPTSHITKIKPQNKTNKPVEPKNINRDSITIDDGRKIFDSLTLTTTNPRDKKKMSKKDTEHVMKNQYNAAFKKIFFNDTSLKALMLYIDTSDLEVQSKMIYCLKQLSPQVVQIYWNSICYTTESGLSILYLICRNQLFEKLPWNTIDTQECFITALCTLRTDKAGVDTNTSVLYYLFANHLNILKLLQNTNFDWQKITAKPEFIKALCALRTDKAESQENMSALYYLFMMIKCSEFLHLNTNPLKLKINWKAISKAPEFIKALCAPRTDKAEDEKNMSALYYLFNIKEGHELLNNTDIDWKTISTDPEFIKALCALRTDKSESQENMSVLYNLFSTKKGHELLSNIDINWKSISKTPEFIKALCALRTDKAESQENMSALCCLFSIKECHELLNNIDIDWKTISKAPEFIKALCALRTDKAEHQKNMSVLYYLFIATKGHELLNNTDIDWKSISKTPEFIKALCALRTDKAESAENMSVLYYLFNAQEGYKLLKNTDINWNSISKTPEFIKALCALRTDKAESEENMSVLYDLFYTQEGNALLNDLDINWKSISKTPEFIKALCALRTDKAESEENMSVLYYLLSNKESSKLLNDMDIDWKSISKTPEFIRALCALRTDKAADNDKNISVLYILTVNNIKILNMLDWDEIIHNDNFLQALFVYIPHLQNSIFNMLWKTIDGQQILRKMKLDTLDTHNNYMPLKNAIALLESLPEDSDNPDIPTVGEGCDENHITE